MKILIYASLIITICNSSCKKEKSELEKLPPATQTGAKTFGCLVNGKAFLPDNGCVLLCPQALKIIYENINNGTFGLQAELSVNGMSQYINIVTDSILLLNQFVLSNDSTSCRNVFSDFKKTQACQSLDSWDSSVIKTGILKFTRVDITHGIFAGTFEFILAKNGCETITVTNGRFDTKI